MFNTMLVLERQFIEAALRIKNQTATLSPSDVISWRNFVNEEVLAEVLLSLIESHRRQASIVNSWTAEQSMNVKDWDGCKMRRARLRTAVNLSSAQQRRRPQPGPEQQQQQQQPEESGNQIERRASEKENDVSPVKSPPPTPTTPASNSAPAVIRLKQRFKPNLVVGESASVVRNRLRKISGSEGPLGSPRPFTGRVRTTSTSSVTSDGGFPESLGSPPPMLGSPPQQLMSPGRSDPKPPVVERLATLPRSAARDEDEPSPRSIKSRQRRLTETSTTGGAAPPNESTMFDKRKADHKKKFTQGIPERTKITMFDLIYYNPTSGNRMSLDSSNPSSTRTSRANSVDSRRNSVRTNEDEEAETIDDPLAVPTPAPSTPPPTKEEKEEEEDAMPAPQVKVGPDGSIIIDETSTVIDTTAAKQAKIDLLNSPLVFESSNKATNYGSWGKKRKNVDWSTRETVRFFKALSVFGTDFSMMENVFKRRTRQDLKMKFKKEERSNRQLVDKCLSQGLKFDASFFDEDSEQEENEEELARLEKEEKMKKKEADKKRREEERKANKTTTKKRVRKVKAKRGYFESSEEEDASSSLASPAPRDSISSDLSQGVELDLEEPLPKRPRRRPQKTQPNASGDGSLLKAILEKNKEQQQNELPTASFPPGLLAANPSLANAAAGSLVVVGGGSTPMSPNQQLLHVFRMNDDEVNQKESENKR